MRPEFKGDDDMPTAGLRQAALMASAATVLVFAAAATQAAAMFALLVGSVSTAGESSVPIVVVALDRKADRVVHRTFLETKRAFRMPLVPGRYKLYAFADANRNGVRDPSELTSVMYAIATPLRAGELIELPALRIQP
jgi:hypothetical protein